MATKIIVEDFDDDSQKIIELFLSQYNSNSIPTYKNLFRRIGEVTQKRNLRELTLDDYKILKEKITGNLLDQLFKNFYVSDIFDNMEDFESEFGSKEIILRRMEKRKNKKIKEYRPAISISDLDKLIKFEKKVQVTDSEVLRLAFCFYMLFYQQLTVGELSDLDAKNYSEGFVKISDVKIVEVPEKYQPFIEELRQRKSNTKFSTVNENVDQLGRFVGIDNLTPFKIITAGKERLITCPECGKKYLSKVENWVGVNSYLLCLACFEKIDCNNSVKKKSQFAT